MMAYIILAVIIGDMVITLTGSNDYLRNAELLKIRGSFVKEQGDFGVEQFEADQLEPGRLLESVASLPFLASRRLIILYDISANKVLGEAVEQLLDAVADSTDLVIVERKLDKRLSLYKTLKKRTDFKEFLELDEQGLAKWLVAEAKSKEGELSFPDALYMVQRLGTNQMGLSNELDKLLTYQVKITKETIDLLTEPLPQSSVFELLDAAFSGNRQKTLSLYEDQRKQQVEPQAIMGMIAWQVHILAVVKYNEKKGAETIAKEAKLSPFVVRKTLNLCKHLSRENVKELVAKALDLDVRLKSEMIDADDALQHFLLTI